MTEEDNFPPQEAVGDLWPSRVGPRLQQALGEVADSSTMKKLLGNP